MSKVKLLNSLSHMRGTWPKAEISSCCCFFFLPFYLFSFQDMEDLSQLNIQVSEMDDTSHAGSSRKS